MMLALREGQKGGVVLDEESWEAVSVCGWGFGEGEDIVVAKYENRNRYQSIESVVR